MLAAVFKRQRDQNTLRSRSELLLIPSCDVYPSRPGKPERAVGFATGFPCISGRTSGRVEKVPIAGPDA
jgi:hypothetical protein